MYMQICQATKDSNLTNLMKKVQTCSFVSDIDKAQKDERSACDAGRR